MSYQKCPVCNGTGVDQSVTFSTGVPNKHTHPCGVCEGTGIISELTGKPPKSAVPDLPEQNVILNDLLNRQDHLKGPKQGCTNPMCFCTGDCELPAKDYNLSNKPQKLSDLLNQRPTVFLSIIPEDDGQ